jgi:transcriptional regulator with XRE-family HTH domain
MLATASKDRRTSRGSAVPAKKDVKTDTYSGRVAARLRELRDAKGWTVLELTEKINLQLRKDKRVAPSTVHGWDNGSRKLDPDMYPVVAAVFRMSVRHFLPSE